MQFYRRPGGHLDGDISETSVIVEQLLLADARIGTRVGYHIRRMFAHLDLMK